jgi:hypothetical protein
MGNGTMYRTLQGPPKPNEVVYRNNYLTCPTPFIIFDVTILTLEEQESPLSFRYVTQ